MHPGIDSNLSNVPPVWPNPLPDILANFTPHAATKGPSTKEVLSPTPPVECLSTFIPSMLDKSIVSPECNIASVNIPISFLFIPLNNIAIAKEDA